MAFENAWLTDEEKKNLKRQNCWTLDIWRWMRYIYHQQVG